MYEPYPIADVSVGLYGAKEPWIAPERTWRELDDMVIRRGRLEVRRGFRVFGTCYPEQVDTDGGNLGLTVTGGTLTQLPVHPAELAPSTYKVTFVCGAQTVTDDGAGNLVGSGTGTINYLTGVWAITWGAPCALDSILITYEYEAGAPVLGLINSFDGSTRLERLWAFTPTRAFLWNLVEERFYDHFGVDWTLTPGDASDRLVICEFRDAVYFSDNVNRPRKVVGASLGVYTLDTVGDGSNHVDTARLITRHRERVLYAGLKIDGTFYLGRVWLSVVNNPEKLDLDRWSDIPTEAAILNAVTLGDTIVYFCEGGETWAFRYTGDPVFPYAWENLSTTRGCDSSFGSVAVDRAVLAMGTHALIECNGLRVDDADESTNPNLIRDLVNTEFAYWTSALVVPEHEEVWWSVVGKDSEEPSTTLVLSTSNASFARFRFAVNCWGRYRRIGTITWDDHAEDWDDWDEPFDDYRLQAEFPSILGGDFNPTGRVYEFDVGDTDNGVEIVGRAKSQQLNPYKLDRCRLGHVDVIADRMALAKVTVRLARQYRDAPYAVVERDLESTATPIDASKVRRRVPANQIAERHTIELEARGLAGKGIDAVVPYFARVGVGREIA